MRRSRPLRRRSRQNLHHCRRTLLRERSRLRRHPLDHHWFSRQQTQRSHATIPALRALFRQRRGPPRRQSLRDRRPTLPRNIHRHKRHLPARDVGSLYSDIRSHATASDPAVLPQRCTLITRRHGIYGWWWALRELFGESRGCGDLQPGVSV